MLPSGRGQEAPSIKKGHAGAALGCGDGDGDPNKPGLMGVRCQAGGLPTSLAFWLGLSGCRLGHCCREDGWSASHLSTQAAFQASG